MADPYSTLRARPGHALLAACRLPIGLGPVGLPAFVGQVFAASHLPTALGSYYSVHPVAVLGTEGEGLAPSLSTDPTTSALVCVLGSKAPALGDYLVCRFEGGRWVAERGTPPAPAGPTTASLPGCLCVQAPGTLTMSSSGPCVAGDFIPCTLQYGPTPSSLSGIGLGTDCFLSTETFTDATSGRSFRYNLSCYAIYFQLSRVYLPTALAGPYHDATVYTWSLGLPGNSCSPFLLSNGTIYSGGNPACLVTISP